MVDTNILDEWKKEQENLKSKLKLYDTEPWQFNKAIYVKEDYPRSLKLCDFKSEDNSQQSMNSQQSVNNQSSNQQSNSQQSDNDNNYNYDNNSLRFVGGFDISFVKDKNTACSGLFIFDLSDEMKIVYQDLDQTLVEMSQPYIPGFLAYREAPFLLRKLERLKAEHPEFYPQVILIDGNGILHPNGFGMACHCGVLSDTPTIGISKNLLKIFDNTGQTDAVKANENESIEANIDDNLNNNLNDENELIEAKTEENKLIEANTNDNLNDNLNGNLNNNLNNDRRKYFELKLENKTVGISYQSSKKPIYISLGHKISWETAIWVVGLVTKKFRIPEPIRMADILTRRQVKKLTEG